MTELLDITFNFNDATYIPPDLFGGIYNFTNGLSAEIVGYLNQVYTDNTYIYTATSTGLILYTITNSRPFAYVSYSGGFTTLGGNTEKIYLGTTNSGIKYLNKSDINIVSGTAKDITVSLVDLYTPNITSSNVKYLNVKDDHLLVCTAAGVDHFRYNQNPYIHCKTLVSGTQKCFITDSAMY